VASCAVKPGPGFERSDPVVDRETEWVSRAAAGDREAFRALVDAHRDRAYALALRVTRSPADAEEVAQDAFVRAWRALPRFRGEARFGTWLHRIVLRRALDRAGALRRRAAREVVAESAALEALAPAVPAAREPAHALSGGLARLPERQRAAVALYYGEDRSVEQVAHILGIPENTVKTHLSRARATLRALWQRQEEPA
jgi:RNA polymerase sigma-70 factor (ECF subfamily)